MRPACSPATGPRPCRGSVRPSRVARFGPRDRRLCQAHGNRPGRGERQTRRRSRRDPTVGARVLSHWARPAGVLERGPMPMIRQRRTRIVATLGPASQVARRWCSNWPAGALTSFRLNFSHGVHQDHADALAAVRDAEETELARPLAVLADLQGPKFPPGRVQGRRVSTSPRPRGCAWISTPPLATAAAYNCPIPRCSRSCARALTWCWTTAGAADRSGREGRSRCEVIAGERLSGPQGTGGPRGDDPGAGLTDKDRDDLEFAAHRRRLGGAVRRQDASDAADLRHAGARSGRHPGQDRKAGGPATWRRSWMSATG